MKFAAVCKGKGWIQAYFFPAIIRMKINCIWEEDGLTARVLDLRLRGRSVFCP